MLSLHSMFSTFTGLFIQVGRNVRLSIAKQDHPGDGFSCKNEDGVYPLKSDGSYSRFYFACVGGIAYPKVIQKTGIL